MIVKIFTIWVLDQGTFYFNISVKFSFKIFIHLITSSQKNITPGVLKIDNKNSNKTITKKKKEKQNDKSN